MSKIIIISWPSAVWKTTIWNVLLWKAYLNLEKVVTTTTRSLRNWELNWLDYYFTTKEDFENRISNGEFIEYANVHWNYYWSTYSELERILKKQKNVFYNVDPQWAKTLKNNLENKYNVTSIFLLPSSIEELKKRLKNRGEEDESNLQKRLDESQKRIQEKDFYDYNVVNSDFYKTIENIEKIIMNNR